MILSEIRTVMKWVLLYVISLKKYFSIKEVYDCHIIWWTDQTVVNFKYVCT